MMNARKNEVNMLEGAMLPSMLKVALPLAAISILQQFFNAADVAVVGSFASDNAVAAVGANTPIVNMFLTLFTGLSTGGNVAISTLIGKGDRKNISAAVHTVYALSLISALIVALVGEIIARPVLNIVNTPSEVISQAELYLRIYLIAMCFAVIYNFASAILRSKGDTKRPLYILIMAGVVNLVLNLVLVAIFHLDVAGVAIATLISNILCAGVTTALLLKEEEPFRLDISNLKFHKWPLEFTLRIGLPAGIQGMLFSVSNVILQAGINGFGAQCIAGNTAAMNLEFITYFVVNAFSQTATTFISQNYGAKNVKRCKKAYMMGTVLGFSLCLLLSLFCYINSGLILGLFSNTKGVLDYAMIRMKLVVLLECLTIFNDMGSAGLRGVGISLPPTIISVSGSCIFRIIWVNTIFKIWPTIETLLLVYPVSWILLGIVQTLCWIFYSRRIFGQNFSK